MCSLNSVKKGSSAVAAVAATTIAETMNAIRMLMNHPTRKEASVLLSATMPPTPWLRQLAPILEFVF